MQHKHNPKDTEGIKGQLCYDLLQKIYPYVNVRL